MLLNFAHRGSLTEAPENTISAMKKALEHQAKAIELDVQLTKDGELIVVHDQSLTRFNIHDTKFIKDNTLAEIKQIDVGSSFFNEFTGEKLATLEEVLAVCPDDVVLNIEIKNIPIIYEGIEEKVIYTLEKHNRLDNIIISSFDHVALEKVQTVAPDIPLGMLFYYRILKPWEYAKHSGLNLTSVHPLVSYINQQMIDEFHKLGLKVYPFTVNDIKHYEMLVEAGVDGVFTNNPKIFGGNNLFS